MAKLTVGDLMTDQIFSVKREDDLGTAYDLMDSVEVRHLPVITDEGEIVGLISQRDLLRTGLFADEDAEEGLTVTARRDLLAERQVQEVMTPDPTTVAADDDIRDAAELLQDNKISCLPVTDGDVLVGILTESDFVRFVAEHTEDIEDSVRFERRPSRRVARDGLTGSSSQGDGTRYNDAGLTTAGIGGTLGSETGEGTRATVPGGWAGTDDDTSTSADEHIRDLEHVRDLETGT